MRGIARGVPIVFEDHDILVVDKPRGMLSAYVGGPRGEGYEGDDLFSLVKKYVRGNSKSRVRAPVFVVHRLDREVSGLMIFAKSERALRWLKEELRARRLHRIYFAVVEGELPTSGPESSGTVQSYLRETGKGVVESTSSPGAVMGTGGRLSDDADRAEIAKPAVTHWRSVNAGNGRSLVQVRLETGRKNQIRVHMKDLGHPICGDRKYGSVEDPIGRVCLHAHEISFTHAFTGRAVRLKSPVPKDFFRLVGAGRDEAAVIEGGAPITVPAAVARSAKEDAGWDHVAGWYDRLIEEGRSDHFERVIIPGALRLLEVKPGQAILDVACGQGAFCRLMAGLEASVTGLDVSPKLIEAARRAGESGRGRVAYEVCDARDLVARTISGAPFDAVSCLMALMNIEPLSPVFAGISRHLKPGGRFVSVILHPAFRAPGQTGWGWDEPKGPTEASMGRRVRRKGRFDRDQRAARASEGATAIARQYRRVDGYLSEGHSEIVMNPGAASSGAERVVTLTHHRPIQTYVRLLSAAGFTIDALEEWPSVRQSQPGPRAAEENRARREIPMFLAIRAIRMTR